MGDIVITGLAANDPVPGSYIDVLFAQGGVSGSAADYAILLLGNKLSTGSATLDTVLYGPDTPVQLQSEADCIALFGSGSELHRMYRRVVAVNQSTSVYAVAVTQSAGAQATATITVTVTATANATARWFVGDESVDSSIATGDTVTAVAAAGVAAINSMTHWPVTASNVAGVITLTAKQAGLRGNDIRYMTQVIGSGVGTSITGSADSFMTGGTTADSNATALTTVVSKRFYYIASAASDATQLGAVSSQVDAMAAPIVGLRQRFFGGSVDTLANATTVATGLNTARGTLTWLKAGPLTPAELAANQAAIESLFENRGTSPRLNFAGFGNSEDTRAYWKVKSSRDTTATPTRTNIKSALNSGVTPIGVNTNGSTYLVNRITTRSLSGAVADYRIRDSHKVTVADRFGDDMNAKNVLNFSGFKIADDPPEGSLPDGPDVLTPAVYRSAVFGLINVYDGNDLLENVATIKANTVVQRATSPTSRMTAHVPLDIIECAFQFGVVVAQVG